MELKKEQYEQLVRIFNTLNTVYTNGKNSLIMGTCLQNLEQLIYEINDSSNMKE